MICGTSERMKHPKCRTCGERHRLGPCPGQVIDHDPGPVSVIGSRRDKLAAALGAPGRLTPKPPPLTVEHVKAKVAVPPPLGTDEDGSMAKITVRLPVSLIARVDSLALAAARGGSRSRAIRHLILIGLNGEQP